jgi:hypothetical protein
MIELIMRVGKNTPFSKDIDCKLDKRDPGYNFFHMVISDDKIAEVEELIKHYTKYKTNEQFTSAVKEDEKE